MTTRSVLESAIEDWIIRDDLSEDASNFALLITIAENRLNRVTRAALQEKSSTVNFTGRSAALPADFLELRHAFVDSNANNYKFEYKTPEALRQSGEWANGRVGRFYTIEGQSGSSPNEVLLMTIAGPASAASSLSVEIHYLAKWALGAESGATNWLLKNHFDLYLWECLVQAAIISHSWDLKDKYEMEFAKVVNEFSLSENRKRFGGQAKTRSNSPRAIV